MGPAPMVRVLSGEGGSSHGAGAVGVSDWLEH
jgi:hypothetical protein